MGYNGDIVITTGRNGESRSTIRDNWPFADPPLNNQEERGEDEKASDGTV